MYCTVKPPLSRPLRNRHLLLPGSFLVHRLWTHGLTNSLNRTGNILWLECFVLHMLSNKPRTATALYWSYRGAISISKSGEKL